MNKSIDRNKPLILKIDFVFDQNVGSIKKENEKFNFRNIHGARVKCDEQYRIRSLGSNFE